MRFARDISAARTLTFFGSAVAAALLLFVGVRLPRSAVPGAGDEPGAVRAHGRAGADAPAFGPGRRRLCTSRSRRSSGGLASWQSHAGDAQPARRSWAGLRSIGRGFEHRPGLGHQRRLADRGARGVGRIGGASGAGKTTHRRPGRRSAGAAGWERPASTAVRWRAKRSNVGERQSLMSVRTGRCSTTASAAISRRRRQCR